MSHQWLMHMYTYCLHECVCSEGPCLYEFLPSKPKVLRPTSAAIGLRTKCTDRLQQTSTRRPCAHGVLLPTRWKLYIVDHNIHKKKTLCRWQTVMKHVFITWLIAPNHSYFMLQCWGTLVTYESQTCISLKNYDSSPTAFILFYNVLNSLLHVATTIVNSTDGCMHKVVNMSSSFQATKPFTFGVIFFLVVFLVIKTCHALLISCFT